MENNKGQSIFLSVVGIATLLVAIIGATFAYFSVTVTGNEAASSITVTTANVGGVTFADASEAIIGSNIYPGWSKSKTFTITSDADANSEIDYEVYLEVTANDLSAVAEGAFVYSFEASQTGVGTGILTAEKAETAVPGIGTIENTANIIATGTLSGAANQHQYDFKIAFKETNSDQNAAQGKSFAGRIQVKITTDSGQRTWNNENGEWITYEAPSS